MDAGAGLEEIMGKEAWTAEDCRRIRELLAEVADPVRKFREMAADLAARDPAPSGAAAVKLGIARYMLCRLAEAAEVLAKGTDNKERRFYQAMCHKHLRQWSRALECLDRAEDRGWDPREVTLERAEVQILVGDLAAAGKSLDRFAKSSQEDPNWHYLTGFAAEAGGDYDAAMASYETARRLQPEHPQATFRLAYHYDLHGDEDRAIELYQECIGQAGGERAETRVGPQPVHANALINLAVLHEDAGRYDEAERYLRRLLAANPNHPRARLFLKDVRASRTMTFDEDEAKRIAKRNDLLAIPVTDFELSVRARNCLKKMNIRTLGDLLHVTEPDLLSFKNFGETSLAEIKKILASKGLRLGQMRQETQAAPEGGDGAVVGDEGVLATPMAQIELSARVRSALERLNIATLGELASKTEAELLGCRNFGQTSLNEVAQRLAEYGLNLREAP